MRRKLAAAKRVSSTSRTSPRLLLTSTACWQTAAPWSGSAYQAGTAKPDNAASWALLRSAPPPPPAAACAAGRRRARDTVSGGFVSQRRFRHGAQRIMRVAHALENLNLQFDSGISHELGSQRK